MVLGTVRNSDTCALRRDSEPLDCRCNCVNLKGPPPDSGNATLARVLHEAKKPSISPAKTKG